MARRGGSFGMVVLIVTVAIVLLLVAKNWQAVAPSAAAVLDGQDDGALSGISAHGQTDAAEALRDGGLPGLGEMQGQTDAHADAVREAMEAID